MSGDQISLLYLCNSIEGVLKDMDISVDKIKIIAMTSEKPNAINEFKELKHLYYTLQKICEEEFYFC